MEERFEMVKNRVRTGQLRYAELFSLAQAEQVRKFHAGFPEYQKTPLVSMEQTARRLGLGKVWIKDESKRFGLNAFKYWEEAMPSEDTWPSGWGLIRRE